MLSMTTDDVERGPSIINHQSWPRAVYLCREGRCQLEPPVDTPSKLSQHGNVVRRGVVPSVTGLCFRVMAWPPAPARVNNRLGSTLTVKYIFTYSCGATTRIRITYVARLTLCMPWLRTYSRFMYAHNRQLCIKCRVLFPRSAYSTHRPTSRTSWV